MFDKDFRITGKHANYWKDLCELAGNVPDRDLHNNFKIFKAYIDAYIVCPLIGYQFNRKGIIDNTEEGNAGMLAEVFGKRRSELKYVYQIIMLLDEESEPDANKRIYRAFRFSEENPEDRKLIEENMKVFNSYFLGGLEILHEEFVEQCHDEDDYLKKMHSFVQHFYDEQDAESIRNKINKYLDDLG